MAKDSSFLGLNRPEYIPSSELLTAELAWLLSRQESPMQLAGDGAQRGVAYADHGIKPKADILITKPTSDDRQLENIGRVFQKAISLRSTDDIRPIAKLFLDEIEAPASAKATRSPAIPLTSHAALLQDRRGITGKNNPANIGLILEQIYAIGQGRSSAAIAWANALNTAKSSGMPDWTGDAIKQVLPESFKDVVKDINTPEIPKSLSSSLRCPAWMQAHDDLTPFHWFARTWDRLCNEGWINAMPRRRWTDWAACVARTGISMAYLFEMHINRKMLAGILGDDDPEDFVRSMLEESCQLLKWDEGLRGGTRDVGPLMRVFAESGAASISLLDKLISGNKDGRKILPALSNKDPDGLVQWLVEARKAAQTRSTIAREVSSALDAKMDSSAKNVWETMRYSILDRTSSSNTDLYGLLKKKGRYTWVEPGQEWLVTITSLCSDRPGCPARLGDLVRALRQLGIEAAIPTLVSRLETYGLAQSSHDADNALEIMPGF